MDEKKRRKRQIDPEDSKNIRRIMAHLLLNGPFDVIPTAAHAISWALKEAVQSLEPRAHQPTKVKVG